MGKRSDFERHDKDFYVTPREAVIPLTVHIAHAPVWFCEPCAGDGALVRHLEWFGHHCTTAWDIEPRAEGIEKADARTRKAVGATMFITNPPWTRDILHELIVALSDQLPTWLLFDADWFHTEQSIPFLPRLRKVVSVGRVRWIPGTTMDGKDNVAWYKFDFPLQRDPPWAELYGRTK